MKKLILLIVLIPCLTKAHDITGKWNGILSVQGMELRLVFHISREDSTYDAKMDSPDQKAFGIPASATNFENSTLNIEIDKLKSIKCPVLALNGEKDVQVAPENLIVIEKAIRHGGNDNVTVKEFPDVNHLFQTCKTGQWTNTQSSSKQRTR